MSISTQVNTIDLVSMTGALVLLTRESLKQQNKCITCEDISVIHHDSFANI